MIDGVDLPQFAAHYHKVALDEHLRPRHDPARPVPNQPGPRASDRRRARGPRAPAGGLSDVRDDRRRGAWTPTAFAARVAMPLSTVLFRVGRLESRGHAERIPNPDHRRSYLVRLTPEGQRLLAQARPRFRAYAEAVEARLGEERVGQLRDGLTDLREAMEQEVSPE